LGREEVFFIAALWGAN